MSVFRRGKKWGARAWVHGRWEWLGTFETRREAKDAEREAAGAAPLSRITVAEFCDLWLRDYARKASSSRNSYHYAVTKLREEFGSRRLGSISRPEAQRWARSVPYFSYRAARTLYADALRDGLIQSNPFAQLRIPVPEGRRDIDVLTEGEVKQLADTALSVHDEHTGPTVRALILVAGFAGLRPAELAELDWGDVDLEGGLLHVRHATGGEGERKKPKTDTRRVCVLPPPGVEALARLERHEGHQAVFLTPRLRRFNKGAIHRYFEPVRAAFGRPKLTPYELRHACATLLLERGLSPSDVARQLGHRDGGILVQRLYGHPSEDRARERIAMAFATVADPSQVEANRG